MIVVSLNAGGGVRLIKPAKLYMHMCPDRCMAPGVRGHGSEPLHHSREVVTRNGLYAHTDSLISASEYAEDLVTKFTSLIGQWTNSPKHRSW